MRINNILIIIVILFGFSGCAMRHATYQNFKMEMNKSIGKEISRRDSSFRFNRRKIYDKNHYIYIVEYPKGCIYGYLTNRDNKIEKMTEWIIISGKKYCKEY